MFGDFPYNEDYQMRHKDGIDKSRDSVLNEVLNEINKVHYSRTPVAFTHSELLDILRRLRV